LLRVGVIRETWGRYVLAGVSYGTPVLYGVAGVALFAFVVRYVGTVSVGFRHLVAALSLPVLVLMPFATTTAHLTDGDAEAFPLLASEVTPTLRISSFVVAPYHFALALAALGVLLWAVYRYEQPSLRFVSMLFLAGPLWYFSNYVTAPVLGTSNPTYYAINLLIGGVGLAALLWVRDPTTFQHERPAASVLGRDELIEGLRDPVLAVDRNGRIVDGNPPATRLFDSPLDDFQGREIGAVVPDCVDDDALRTTGTHELRFDEARRFETSVSTITDATGREFGRVFVFRDVTEERRREQRLQVLNRVLRHNLRNEGNVVDGAVERLVNDPAERDRYGAMIRERIRKLVEVGEKARTIEQLVSADPRQDSPTNLDPVLQRAIDRANEDQTNSGSVSVDKNPSIGIVANDFVLEAVVGELVGNALEHAGSDAPRVAVFAERDPSGALDIAVEDDGPGIPDHETVVLDRGQESALEHGSGIGLWLVKWGSERIGADVRFETPSSCGTRAVLRLPGDLVTDPSTGESE
jgi:signal transduction histidine kinase